MIRESVSVLSKHVSIRFFYRKLELGWEPTEL